MIEALACGTPVIAWPHGSVPEVIEHGKTGYLVETINDAVAAVKQIGRIDRAVCRQVFEQRFDARSMARHYETLYWSLIQQGVPSRARTCTLTPAAEETIRG